MLTTDQIIATATVRRDDNGQPIVATATCGYCGRSWNDAAVSSLTPTPSGRCPWESDHDPDDLWADRMADLDDDRATLHAIDAHDDDLDARIHAANVNAHFWL